MSWTAMVLVAGIIVAGLIAIWLLVSSVLAKPRVSKWFKDHWPKTDGSKKSYVRAHPWKTVLWVLVLIWLAPILVFYVIPWIVAIPLAIADYNIRGTHPSAWGIVDPPPIDERSFGKSVGGPLRWNEAAMIELRPRISREPVDENGICFAGIIPPASWANKKFATFENKNSWSAYSVDYTTANRFMEPEFLTMHATTEKEVPVGIYQLTKLPSTSAQLVNFRNDTGSARGNEPVLLEQYLQITGDGPGEITIETVSESKGITEYHVTVGLSETTFSLPAEGWKWLWIAAVHHGAYQATMDELPVPAEGVSVGDHKNHLAVVAVVNGKPEVLDKALLIRPDGMRVSVSLVLNSTAQKIDDGSVQPAKIIVGIQL